MRRIKLSAPVLALALFACAQELALPSNPADRAPVSITPSVAVVAPLESLRFSSSGGLGPYRYALVSDTTDGAAVDGESGEFLVGARAGGEAEVTVTDALGGIAKAAVRVGASLAIVPTRTTTAPGGSVPFSATGGKAPYVYKLAADKSGASIDAETGDYRAGPTPNVVDVVEIADATGRVTQTAEVEIGRAIALLASSTDPVAPGGSVALVVLGGQPPYALSVEANASRGASIDEATFVYQAGPTGNVTDRLRAVDRNGQSATCDIAVGAPLSARLDTEDLRPGVLAHVVASGGRPPYRFAFAARGNRSFGTLEASTGNYLPGPNVGTEDVIEIADATQRRAIVLTTPRLGPKVLPAGAALRCFGADMDNDGLDESIATSVQLPFCPQCDSRRIVVMRGATVLSTIYMSEPVNDVVPFDVDADRRADLLVLVPSGLQVIRSGPDGRPLPALHLWRRSGSVVTGKTLLAVAASETGALQAFVVDGPGGLCGASSGIARLSVDPVSMAVTSTCLGTSSPDPVLAAAADFDGDGEVDLAWVASDQLTLHFQFGPGFASTTSVSAPTGHTVTVPFALNSSGGIAVVSPSAAATPRLVVALEAPNGVNSFWVVSAAARMPIGDRVEIESGAHWRMMGVTTAASPALDWTGVLAWSGLEPTIRELDFAPDGSYGFVSRFGDYPYAVDCVAGEATTVRGVADLVTNAMEIDQSDVIEGFGAEGFGRRRSFDKVRPAVTGDFDGDGLTDVVAQAGARLEFFAGTSGQLAKGAVSIFAVQPFEGMSAADFSGDGKDDLVYSEDGRGIVIRNSLGDGRFGPASPLLDAQWQRIQTFTYLPRPCRLGGGALGDDVCALNGPSPLPLGGYQDWGLTGYVRNANGATTVVDGPMIQARCCQLVLSDVNGDGLDDGVAACRGLGPAGAPSEGRVFVAHTLPGATPAFGPWSVVHTFSAPAGHKALLAAFAASNGAAIATFTDREATVRRTEMVRVDVQGVHVSTLALDYRVLQTGDVNGDGLADLIMQPARPDGTEEPNIRIALATADGFEPPQPPMPFNGSLAGTGLLGGPGRDVFAWTGKALVVYENDGAGNF